MTLTPTRYHRAAIILHWVMAVAIISMITMGFSIDLLPLEKAQKFALIQLHKSIGIVLLISVWLRIVIRLMKPHPALPENMKPMEKRLAKLGHAALYGLMIAVPFSGWAMVSSSSYGLPTMLFGWVEWPHIPGIAGNKAINEVAHEGHELLNFAFIALIAAHVLAVIKHRVKDGINLLPRMGIGQEK